MKCTVIWSDLTVNFFRRNRFSIPCVNIFFVLRFNHFFEIAAYSVLLCFEFDFSGTISCRMSLRLLSLQMQSNEATDSISVIHRATQKYPLCPSSYITALCYTASQSLYWNQTCSQDALCLSFYRRTQITTTTHLKHMSRQNQWARTCGLISNRWIREKWRSTAFCPTHTDKQR